MILCCDDEVMMYICNLTEQIVQHKQQANYDLNNNNNNNKVV